MYNKLSLELLSWLIIVIIIVAILSPIYTELDMAFPYYAYNTVCIFVFLYFTKHIFLLRHSLFSHHGVVKFVLLLCCIPLLLYIVDGHYEAQRFFDEDGLYNTLSRLDPVTQISLSKYIRYEMVFFAVGSFIVALMLPIRLIVSEWRIRNRGTV